MAASYNVYYFDGLNFANATSIYDDVALTTLSADGYYSQNGIVRQQVNGVLLNAQSCNSCAVPCGSGVQANFNQAGYFNAVIDVGSNTGAVYIYSKMNAAIPDGMVATYNNVPVNRMTAKNNHNGVVLVDCNSNAVDYAGVNQQPAQAHTPTYVGNDNFSTCGTYNNIDEYNLVNNSYVLSGGTRQVTITTNQVGCATDTSTDPSPVFTMIVPKTDPTVTTIEVEVFAPLGGTVFDWELLCPVELPAFNGSALQNTTDCTTNTTQYFYARNATGNTSPFTQDSNSLPEVGNFVFTDANGATYVNDTSALRYIIINSTTAIGVRNGVVVTSGTCTNTGGFTSFNASTLQSSISPICDGGPAPATGQTYYHNGSGAAPANGDIVYLDAAGNSLLPAGIYYVSTNSGTNTYMTIGLNGAVLLGTCTPPSVTFFISALGNACNVFCNNNYLIGSERGVNSNNAFAGVQIGDVISGSSLTAGWYAYAATSTNTQTGTFRIMQVGTQNNITSRAECNNQTCISV